MVDSDLQSEEERFPVLSVLIGAEMGKIFTIRKTLTTIGRGEDRDVQLIDRTVSRLHSEILYENDVIIIRDANSQNGIRVNGQDVLERELMDGDQIDIGSVRLVIRKPKKEDA